MPFRLNRDAAELVGILLGDGSFYISKYNNEVDIALDLKDANYKKYVKYLLKSVTGTYVWEKYDKTANCVHLRISRKSPTSKLLNMSYKKPGDKIKNKVSIPMWIWNKETFLKLCIKGLIDTDGSIYRLKPHWPNPFQLSFKNNNERLLEDVRKAFLKLGFHPSKIFGNRIVITRQIEISKYFTSIGTSNDTHLNEYVRFLKIKSSNNNCIAP